MAKNNNTARKRNFKYLLQYENEIDLYIKRIR